MSFSLIPRIIYSNSLTVILCPTLYFWFATVSLWFSRILHALFLLATVVQWLTFFLVLCLQYQPAAEVALLSASPADSRVGLLCNPISSSPYFPSSPSGSLAGFVYWRRGWEGEGEHTGPERLYNLPLSVEEEEEEKWRKIKWRKTSSCFIQITSPGVGTGEEGALVCAGN